MNDDVFILIGKSGSGKGTQAELLIAALKAQSRDVLHIEMGDAFRSFLKESTYTASLANEVAKTGGLQPDFLANYFWVEELMKFANGKRGFVFDGTPRTKRQARILDSALRFYGAQKPTVIHLAVDDDNVIERMKERGRGDDQIEAIKTRLTWFNEDTMRAIEFFKERPDYYRYIELDGNRGVDSIHVELMDKIT